MRITKNNPYRTMGHGFMKLIISAMNKDKHYLRCLHRIIGSEITKRYVFFDSYTSKNHAA